MAKEITLDTKISELLNDYENMKDILIDINPKFKKLNNPVLKRTLAKVASVRQAAFVGAMEPVELLNLLRAAVGQDKVNIDSIDTQKECDEAEVPNWVIGVAPSVTLDANEILNNNLNPLAESTKFLKQIKDDEFISLSADFWPEPLIEELVKSGYQTYLKKINDSEFITFIKK